VSEPRGEVRRIHRAQRRAVVIMVFVSVGYAVASLVRIFARLV